MALVQVEGTMLTLDKTGCWASSGHTAQGCAALEQALRDCMAVNVRITALTEFPQFNKSTGSRGLTTTLTETQGRQQEQDQLSPLPPVSSHQGPAQEELDARNCTAVERWGLLKLFGITHSDIGTAFLGVVQNGGLLPEDYPGEGLQDRRKDNACINRNCMIRTGFYSVREQEFWEVCFLGELCLCSLMLVFS